MEFSVSSPGSINCTISADTEQLVKLLGAVKLHPQTHLYLGERPSTSTSPTPENLTFLEGLVKKNNVSLLGVSHWFKSLEGIESFMHLETLYLGGRKLIWTRPIDLQGIEHCSFLKQFSSWAPMESVHLLSDLPIKILGLYGSSSASSFDVWLPHIEKLNLSHENLRRLVKKPAFCRPKNITVYFPVAKSHTEKVQDPMIIKFMASDIAQGAIAEKKKKSSDELVFNFPSTDVDSD